ncbi:hypothetical protein U1Q18_005767 [Sarracenia purpurea var. burkii]
MHSWWESVSKARSRIHQLSSLLPHSSATTAVAALLLALVDSARPARSPPLSTPTPFSSSATLSSQLSDSGDDPLYQWLYDTYQSSDSDLHLVILSFIPLHSGLYLSPIHSPFPSDAITVPSLTGFEAILLSLSLSLRHRD